MSGLPEGWESDYDGRRWFYKYQPTGLIQYHFPKEGDEFPDFVDTFSPVPDLAPEERLESQQQIRRHASTTTPARLSPKKNDGAYGMSATARPVSMTWDGTFEEENTVFQPENFMYLGPGTYNDVSPLAEEEEEAARRVVAGGIEGRVDKSPSKGVSPLGSEKTTPAQGAAHAGPLTGEPVLVPSTVPEEVIHEMPVLEPQAPDPVGIIAEMPTYDTAQAHIETHPPPIEMADHTVLAPIETAVSMMAELPERTSPVERKNDEPQLAPGSLRNYGGQLQPLRTAKSPAEETPAGFQAYKPRVSGNAADIPPNQALLRRSTFQPGEPLANSSPIQPPDRGHAGTPNVLSPPQVPPKRPLDEPSQPQIPPKYMLNQPSQSNAPLGGVNNGSLAPAQQGELSHMPSVLKPARGKVPSQSGQLPQSQAPGPAQGHGYVPPAQGKHHPSMTPAPQVQQQRLQEPRMGIQRINTVPDSLPSQRPQSTAPAGHQGLPLSTMSQQHPPKRPASVMPDMMGGQTQGTNLPYRSPIESIPPTGLPRSATAGPTTQIPPYPIDNPPYPDDRPVRREAPYPEEPFVQKPMPVPGPGPISDLSSPGANNRRHSSFSSALVSPDSRHGSMSFPLQTPSPMEQSRRASTNSSTNPNYTPSPVSQTSSSMHGFSPTPPSVPANQYQQGSYFTMQDIEGQGHNIAARDVLRKKSLSRGADARRSSVGSDSANTQRGSPGPQTPQGYNQGTQGLSRSKSLRQTSQGNIVPESQPSMAPTPPPQLQQGLGRIEEYDEVPSATVSRSSTMSVSPEMKKSSVASSVQPSPATSRRASWQAESPKSAVSGQFQGQMPQVYAGQPLPYGQTPQGAPLPVQNSKQLQRKPSLGKAPQPPGQQMPGQDPRVPQGMPLQQGPGPQGRPIQGQGLPPQGPQGQAPRPGQIFVQTQNAPRGPTPSDQAPGPTKLQKRSTYGPGTPTGQLPPQNQFPQGPIPGQMPPLGQQHPLQMNHPGQGPNGRVQPQVQIPQNQQPGMQPVMGKGSRPVSMQPPTSQSAGAKEGKEGKKWLKWLKGGSKSVSHSPTTPVISSPISPAVGRPTWGGGEYSQPAVWQPVSAAPQQGFQGNMPPQSVQMPSLAGQMAPQPGQPLPQSGQLPPQPGQMQPQQRQMPPQRGQLPPQPAQMQSQPSHMAPRAGQAPPVQPSARQAQHEPQSRPGGAMPLTGPSIAAPVIKSAATTGLPMAAPPRTEPSNNIPHQQPPPRQPSPVEPAYAPRPSEHMTIPPNKAPGPPQPTQTFASNSLQPQLPDTRMSVSPPPPAVSPGLSDAAESSISRMSSHRRDSFSDAGSITTIEVAQAQPQPVLKPSIVQVHRRSTDMWRKSQEVQRNNDSHSSSDVTPRISSETARIGLEPSAPTSAFQHKQPAVQPKPTPQVDVPKQNNTIASLTSKFVQPSVRIQQANKEQPAPLAAEHNSPPYAKPSVPIKHNNDPIKTRPDVSQPPPAKSAAPAVEDKWAKKPVVDYSGGDWGDDDDWDY
ncbi:hypothetical protein ACHAPJ_002832 [Fusarium lateritium]